MHTKKAYKTYPKWARNVTKHFKLAIKLLKYLVNTRHLSLNILPVKNNFVFTVYVDSNFAAKTVSLDNTVQARTSHGGYAIRLDKNTVSHRSKSHKATALSSMEAEIYEAVESGKEACWMRWLMSELGYPQTKPTIIYEDNSACIAYSKNPTSHDHTKHISTRYHWLREKYYEGVLLLQKIDTSKNIADIFTKALPEKQFVYLRDILLNTQLPNNIQRIKALREFHMTRA